MLEELIQLAKEMEAAQARGEALGLSDEEVAFYEALGTNQRAVSAMGDAALKAIATELTQRIRTSVTVDWNLRESARAKIRVLVKRILTQHGYKGQARGIDGGRRGAVSFRAVAS